MSGGEAKQEQGNVDQSNELFAQLSSLPLPQITFNAVVNNVTLSEISSILSFGSRPLAMLIMSPVMAKTFAESLLSLVSLYEQSVGQPVLSMSQINERNAVGSKENV